jgi:hypothetical protein
MKEMMRSLGKYVRKKRLDRRRVKRRSRSGKKRK